MKMKVIGILTIIYGSQNAAFSFSLLAISFLIKLMMDFLIFPNGLPGSSENMRSMASLHGVWLIFMPIAIILSLSFILSGYYLYKGARKGSLLAMFLSVLMLCWFAGYVISCEVFVPPTGSNSFKSFGTVDNSGFDMMKRIAEIFSWVAAFVYTCAYPIFLLIYLSLKRS